MRYVRRIGIAGACGLILTLGGLMSEPGVAMAQPATTAATVTTGTVRPDAFGWWEYKYYPNTMIGYGRCVKDGIALKVGGLIIDFHCSDADDDTGRLALWVYTQIT